MDLLEVEREEILVRVHGGPGEEDGDADGAEARVPPDGVGDQGGTAESFLSVDPVDEGGKEKHGDYEERDVDGKRGGGGVCRDRGQDVGQEAEGGADHKDTNPVDRGGKAMEHIPAHRLLGFRQGGERDEQDDKVDPGDEIKRRTPTDTVGQDATEDKADEEAHRLRAAEAGECDVAPLTGLERAGDDADGARQAEGDGDAVQGPEDDELEARAGEAGGEDEAGGEGAADQVDQPASDHVGYAAGEEERAAAGERIDGCGPVYMNGQSVIFYQRRAHLRAESVFIWAFTYHNNKLSSSPIVSAILGRATARTPPRTVLIMVMRPTVMMVSAACHRGKGGRVSSTRLTSRSKSEYLVAVNDGRMMVAKSEEAVGGTVSVRVFVRDIFQPGR